MKLVSVTGCSTGIAQSKMAAESLKGALKATEDDIRVEIQGTSNTENVLKDEEIEEAEAVIIASDVFVSTERFVDITSVNTSVQAAISDPEKLIEEAKKAREEGREKIKYERDNGSTSVVKKIKGLLS